MKNWSERDPIYLSLQKNKPHEKPSLKFMGASRSDIADFTKSNGRKWGPTVKESAPIPEGYLILGEKCS